MSIVEYPYPQRSLRWFAVRAGKITGSTYPDLMPSDRAKVPWTKTQMGIIYKAVASACTGESEESYSSFDMEWGEKNEPAARKAFAAAWGVEVRECGFFVNSAVPGAGSSPDGIFTKDGKEFSLEIKCPASKTHAGYLDNPITLWEKYKWQCVGESLIPGVPFGAICSYDPRYPEGKQLVIYIPGDIENLKLRLLARLSEAHGKFMEIMAIQDRIMKG